MNKFVTFEAKYFNFSLQKAALSPIFPSFLMMGVTVRTEVIGTQPWKVQRRKCQQVQRLFSHLLVQLRHQLPPLLHRTPISPHMTKICPSISEYRHI